VGGLCPTDLEKYGLEKTENGSLGQNRMGICNEGSYGILLIIIIIIIINFGECC
jgi:hypothetical protein